MSLVNASTDEVLTARQRLFVMNYMSNGRNATKAARDAGYSTPNVAGPNLTNPKKYPVVAAEIERRTKELERQAGIELLDLIKMLATIANFNLQDIVDEDGRFLPIHQLPREVAGCLQEIEMSYRVSGGRDGSPQTRMRVGKLKAYSKLEAIKQLAILLGHYRQEEEARTVNNTTVNNTTNNVTIDWATLAAGVGENQFIPHEAKVTPAVLPPPVMKDEAAASADEPGTDSAQDEG